MRYGDLKDLSVRERVNFCLDKTKKAQEEYNAVLSYVDTESQVESLKETDSPLYGIPVVLKDNVNMKGTVTSAASNMLKNYNSVYDAFIVEKLREAGAIIIAKSSMDELAMGGTNLTSYAGPVLNPYDKKRISGGSSGGSAVLVSCGAVSMAIGSDTGDSIRKPAAYNGIVGVKPTYGRISRYGIIPYASSLDTVGYFNSCVLDAAKTLEVLAGRDDRDMTSSYKEVDKYSDIEGNLKGKKIVVLKNVYDLMDKDSWKNLFDSLIERMKEKGAEVTFISMKEELIKAVLPVYYIISNCEASANHSNLDGIRFGLQQDGETYQKIMISSRTEGFTGFIRKRFLIGSYGLFKDNQEDIFRKAQKLRRLIVDDFHNILDNADALIAPASLKEAPLISEASDEINENYSVAENYMAVANFSGDPSMTIPAGYLNKMPVGLNITCKAFKEKEMFDIALGIENLIKE